MHPKNKNQKTASARGKVRQQETAVSLYVYVDKLVILRRAWLEPRKPGEHAHVDEKITLSNYETDTIVAMLPLAILERERRKKTKYLPKREPCYLADI